MNVTRVSRPDSCFSSARNRVPGYKRLIPANPIPNDPSPIQIPPNRRMKLYHKMLGSQWNELDPLFRHYLDHNNIQAVGNFVVSNGSGSVSEFVARILQLPRKTDKAKVKLTVRPEGDHEIWERSFPDKNLVSVHSVSPDRLLSEDFGTFSFTFRLTADQGGVLFDHVSTFVNVLGMRLRIPRFLSPRIFAREDPAKSDAEAKVSVSLSVPLFGNVLSYGGIITRVSG